MVRCDASVIIIESSHDDRHEPMGGVRHDVPEFLGDVRAAAGVLEGEIEIVFVQIELTLARLSGTFLSTSAEDIDGDVLSQLGDVVLSLRKRHTIGDDPSDCFFLRA